MADNIVTVLDTSVGESGVDQTAMFSFLDKNVPIRFSADLGSGDTVLVQGKAEASDDYETLHTFTDNTPADVYVSHKWRVSRSVDGGGDSVVKVENVYNQDIEAHV